jgi:hypothetical protein
LGIDAGEGALGLDANGCPLSARERAAKIAKDMARFGMAYVYLGGPTPQGGTYLLVTEGGKVVRTGRTSNLIFRRARHDLTYEKSLKFVVDRRTNSYFAQRGREQIINQRYRAILDKQNAISPLNPMKPIYMKAGSQL